MSKTYEDFFLEYVEDKKNKVLEELDIKLGKEILQEEKPEKGGVHVIAWANYLHYKQNTPAVKEIKKGGKKNAEMRYSRRQRHKHKRQNRKRYVLKGKR